MSENLQQNQDQQSQVCLLSVRKMCEKLSISKSTLYKNLKNKPGFPQGNMRLGEKRLWLSVDVDAWLVASMAEMSEAQK